MHDGKLLIHALDSLWQKYQKRLTDCHHEAGEEAVHKLRISTRRLLSLIELLQALAPNPALKKLRKGLKNQLDGFDELRDIQVMLPEINTAIESLPELIPFLRQLQHDERRLLTRISSVVAAPNHQDLPKLLKKAHKHLQDELGKASMKPRLLAIIDSVYLIVMERYRAIDASQPATLHRLRIATKKLRYMLESGQVLLPLPAHHIEGLHDYLTRMGEIQDSSVLLVNLKAFFGDQMPQSIQTHYQRRHSTIINLYLSRREQIKQFWRPNADHAFPWERT